jgi:hypothetical protein
MEIQQTFPSPQNICNQLANCLRTQYWLLRNTTSGHGHDEIWLELARTLTSRMVPMNLFIESQFHSSKKLYRPPSPKELLGKKAFQRYEIYRESQEEEIEDKIKFKLCWQQERARRESVYKIKMKGFTLEEAVIDTISDNVYLGNFSHLFCYILLSQMEELSHLAQRYFLNAVLEYVPLKDEYDSVWGTHIPEGFREQALNTYCEMFASDSAVT